MSCGRGGEIWAKKSGRAKEGQCNVLGHKRELEKGKDEEEQQQPKGNQIHHFTSLPHHSPPPTKYLRTTELCASLCTGIG